MPREISQEEFDDILAEIGIVVSTEETMTMLIHLSNNFHRTSTAVRVPELPFVLSVGQTTRARRALCGIDGCSCSGVLGTRGPQDELLGSIEDLGDGRVRLEARDTEED